MVFEEESAELSDRLLELGLDADHFRVVPRKSRYYDELELD